MKTEKISIFDLPLWLYLMVYLKMLSYALIGYFIFWLVGRNWMIMDFNDLWQPDASIERGMGSVWFIYVWAFGLTLLVGAYAARRSEYREHKPSTIFFKGLGISVMAGVFEELLFRWLAFFVAMVTLRAFNAITFGFIEWINSGFFVPFANWATFGALEPQLIDHPEWILGAAIIVANGDFRDAHLANGFFNYVNSWFLGMVMFYVMFNYGLLAAIFTHVVYDICCFTAAAIATAMKPNPDKRPRSIYATGIFAEP